MQIVVCDDEKDICSWIVKRVHRWYPEEECCVFLSGEEFLDSRMHADILFLDIQMPGRDGMEIARELRGRGERTVLIFITALKEYVFHAFDVSAFHYLVKPFSEEKFVEVLHTAIKQCREQKRDQEEEKCLIIRQKGLCTKVKSSEIIYAEVFNRKIVIHKIDGEVEYYGRMSALEKLVGTDFFRTHRAYLIHLKYVLQYDATTVWLENGAKVLLAKQKFPEFVQNYLQYNKRGRT